MKTCENCKNYDNGVCTIPMWVSGTLYRGTTKKPENTCALHEPLVTMEERDEQEL